MDCRRAPDLVVISGDIANSALPEEYAHATKLLGALKVPFVAIPGNHDRRPLMRELFRILPTESRAGRSIKYAASTGLILS